MIKYIKKCKINTRKGFILLQALIVSEIKGLKVLRQLAFRFPSFSFCWMCKKLFNYKLT